MLTKSEVNQNILSCLKYHTKEVIGGGSLFLLCVSSVKREQKKQNKKNILNTHPWGEEESV